MKMETLGNPLLLVEVKIKTPIKPPINDKVRVLKKTQQEIMFLSSMLSAEEFPPLLQRTGVMPISIDTFTDIITTVDTVLPLAIQQGNVNPNKPCRIYKSKTPDSTTGKMIEILCWLIV